MTKFELASAALCTIIIHWLSPIIVSRSYLNSSRHYREYKSIADNHCFNTSAFRMTIRKKKKKSDSKGCNLQKARALQLVLSQMSIPKSAQQLWSALNDQILSSCCLEMFRDYGCFCRDVILEVHDRCKNHCSP